MVLKYKGLRDLREDLEQEARLAMWKALQTYDKDKSSVYTYMLRPLLGVEKMFVWEKCREEGMFMFGVCATGEVFDSSGNIEDIDINYVSAIEDVNAPRDMDVVRDMVVKALARLSKKELQIVFAKYVSEVGYKELRKYTGKSTTRNQVMVQRILSKAKGNVNGSL